MKLTAEELSKDGIYVYPINQHKKYWEMMWMVAFMKYKWHRYGWHKMVNKDYIWQTKDKTFVEHINMWKQSDLVALVAPHDIMQHHRMSWSCRSRQTHINGIALRKDKPNCKEMMQIGSMFKGNVTNNSILTNNLVKFFPFPFPHFSILHSFIRMEEKRSKLNISFSRLILMSLKKR